MSAVIYVLMMTQLDADAFITGVLWCVLGIAIYLVCRWKYGKAGEFTLDLAASGADDVPPPEEKRAMDREYLVWKVIVSASCVIAVVLYIFPFFVK